MRRPRHRQRETAVEQRGCAGDPVGVDPSGGKLDREGNAVQTPADIGDERRIVFTEFEFAQAFGNPLDEQLARRIGKDVGHAEPVTLRRTIQRKQPVDPFALGAKGFAAGGENMQLRGFPNDALCQGSELVDDVFAAVEDQQHPAAAQERQQPRYRVVGIDGQAKGGGDRAGNEPRRPSARQNRQSRPGPRSPQLTMRDGECDRGLADAAGADDGDEPMQGEFGRDLLDGVVSANHLRERGG